MSAWSRLEHVRDRLVFYGASAVVAMEIFMFYGGSAVFAVGMPVFYDGSAVFTVLGIKKSQNLNDRKTTIT